MSKELHIALQNAIGDLGTDVLRSPFLVNILQDYGALGQHEKGSEQIKERLRELARKGYIESLFTRKSTFSFMHYSQCLHLRMFSILLLLCLITII